MLFCPKTKQAILQRLEKEGLLNRNKMLPFAALPLKVGLITGETTAAFKDFTTTLAHSGFSFEVIPGYAKMQGNSMLHMTGSSGHRSTCSI